MGPRLMELEDERQCFLDEGVYDVVNSLCGPAPSPGHWPGLYLAAAWAVEVKRAYRQKPASPG